MEKSNGSGLTILLVDDEAVLRKAVARVLRLKNYNVIEAEDAMSAHEIYLSHHQEVKLIIADVVMPGMSGPALAEKIRDEFPENGTPTLYLSGYSGADLWRFGLEKDKYYFLEKPFSPQELLERVQYILSSRDHFIEPV